MSKYGCGSGSLIGLVVVFTAISVTLQAQADTQEEINENAGQLTRIFGGSTASVGQFPWQVLVVSVKNEGGQETCGGSIISKTHIMSAAHCFAKEHSFRPEEWEYYVKSIYLFAGVTNKKDRSGAQTNVFEKETNFDHVFIHPDFLKGGPNRAHLNNDITIFKLVRILDFDDPKVGLIALASVEEHIKGKGLTASGWGKMLSGDMPDVLQYVEDLEMKTMEECRAYWDKRRKELTDKQICQITEKKGACGGDSGGPVITEIKRANKVIKAQIGIISYGNTDPGCMDKNGLVSNVLTDVGVFIPWINSITNENSCKDTNKRCLELVKDAGCKQTRINLQCQESCGCGQPSTTALPIDSPTAIERKTPKISILIKIMQMA